MLQTKSRSKESLTEPLKDEETTSRLAPKLQNRFRSQSVGAKDKIALSPRPTFTPPTNLSTPPKVTTDRKPLLAKKHLPIIEGYLLKKKTQLGRPLWAKRYFRIHETLLLVNKKDTV